MNLIHLLFHHNHKLKDYYNNTNSVKDYYNNIHCGKDYSRNTLKKYTSRTNKFNPRTIRNNYGVKIRAKN